MWKITCQWCSRHAYNGCLDCGRAEEADASRSQAHEAQQALLAAQAQLEELRGVLGARDSDVAALQAEMAAQAQAAHSTCVPELYKDEMYYPSSTVR